MNLENIEWRTIAQLTGVSEIHYEKREVDSEAMVHEFGHIVDALGRVNLNAKFGIQYDVGLIIKKRFPDPHDEVLNEVRATAITILVHKAFGRNKAADCERLMRSNIPAREVDDACVELHRCITDANVKSNAAHIVKFLRSFATGETDPALGYTLYT